ncbi:MAG: spore coat protein [Limnochordales bacterium]
MDAIIAATCNDALKTCATTFSHSATEASTPQVRQTFMQLAQTAVYRQGELAKIMEQKGWYTPVPARQEDVQKVVSELKQLTQMPATV